MRKCWPVYRRTPAIKRRCARSRLQNQAADSFTEADTDDALAAKYTEWRVKHSAYTDAIWQISDHAARAEFVMLAVAAILWLLFTRRSLLD